MYVDAYQCPSTEAIVPADCRYAEGVAIQVDEGGVVTGPVGTTVAGELSVDVTVGASVTVSVVPGTGPEGQVAVANPLTFANVADGTTAVFVFVPSTDVGNGDGNTGDGDGDPGDGTGTGTDGDGSGVGSEEPTDPPADTTPPEVVLEVEPVETAPDADVEAVAEALTTTSRPTTPSSPVTVTLAGLPRTGVGANNGTDATLPMTILVGLAIMLLGTGTTVRSRMPLKR